MATSKSANSEVAPSSPGKAQSQGTNQRTSAKGHVITRKRAILGRGQPASAAVKPLGVLFVGTKAPFMSVVKRAIKTLDKGPGGARWSSTKVKTLPERIALAQEAPIHAATTAATGTGTGSIYKAARQREVVILGTSHAISKLALVAAWFQRQQNYVVTVRTRSAVSIDDVYTFVGGEAEDGDNGDNDGGGADADDADGPADTMDIDAPARTATTATTTAATQPHKSTRLRNMSCLEVAVRLK
ncbi:hypothetical protein SPBR_09176 [Sporothrix brasiliensis 5110]|uniref:Uncharacterized protein n=1 Tax=Sporothrix brasiliensis 5110 TaxID=1398154 RepID=A0A0C2FRZ1_9PEZI|nr:uncharacterized protein SPBR_09176 [Sporothrix brasiliensis 5110]KIH93783.1 hypothetical protein SPBR_09176 [Sporothrix brasiliensis 5110]